MLMSSNRNSGGAAKLRYGPNGFRVLQPGNHVICAASGVPILLEDLRYWSVDHQEAYASAELATERLRS